MNAPVNNQVARMMRIRKRTASYTRALAFTACLVALCTALAFRMRGIAKTHTEQVLDCHYAGEAAHTHDANCYDAQGYLVCPLVERELHTHTDACYEETRELICELEESAGHTHTDACYDEEGNLVCGLDESAGHTHTDSCYKVTRTLVCGKKEITEVHTHGPGCFRTVTVDDGESDDSVMSTSAVEQGDSFTDEDPSPIAADETVSKPAQELEGVLKLKDADGNEYVALVVGVKAPKGALPEGTTLKVDWTAEKDITDQDLVKRAEAAVKKANTKAAAAQLLTSIDVSFEDVEGNEIQPTRKVVLKVSYDGIRTAEHPALVRTLDEAARARFHKTDDIEVVRSAKVVNQLDEDKSTGSENTFKIKTSLATTFMVMDVIEEDAAAAESAQEAQTADETPAEGGAAVESPTVVIGEDGGNDQNGQVNSESDPVNTVTATVDGEEHQLIVADESPAEEPKTSQFEGVLTNAAGEVEVTVRASAPDGAFPEGTTMRVKRVNAGIVSDAVEEAVAAENLGTVTDIQAVDITFVDADGNEVEPKLPITVVMGSPLVERYGEPLVVHVDNAGEAEVVESLNSKQIEKRDLESSSDEVVFDADQFSTYCIVITTLTHELTASDGNTYEITVDCPAKAGIPQDAELEVSEITEDVLRAEYLSKTADALGWDPESVTYARFFDISIVVDGRHVQPEAPVTVQIGVVDTESNNLNVVHFAKRRNEVMESTSESGAVTFEADGFSVYAIADKGPLRTYSFYAPDGNGNYSEYYFTTETGQSTYQQKIKTVDGVTEELVVPALPSIADSDTSTFVGWYVYDPNTDTLSDTPFDFGNVPEVTAEEEVILRAKFANFAYVAFHEQYNGSTSSWPITETRRGELVNGTASVRTDDVIVSYDDGEAGDNGAPEMGFRGWSLTPVTAGAKVDQFGNPIQLVESPLEITENVDLYPVFVGIDWLTFSSGPTGSGATYVPPRYYYEDEGEDSFPIPLRTGYNFDGWYTAENGGTKIVNADGSLAISGDTGVFSVVNGELRISEDVTLYGHWSEGQSSYTVVIWRQSVDDDVNATQKTYDFAESFTVNATTGSTASVSNTYKNLAGSGDYVGFYYSRCDNSKTVAGNGSTVLNVFYDRNVHTLTFRTNNTTRRTIRGLYGSSIKEYFPIVGTNGTTYDGYSWVATNTSVYSFALATIETMPDADVTFNGTNRGTQKTIYYYVEVDNASESDGTTFNGKYYTLYKTIRHNYNFLTYDEEYHPINGYTRDRNHANPTFGSNNQADIGRGNINRLYYDRETYNITFTDSYTNQNVIVNGSEVTPVDIKYKQRISDYVPADPTSTREGYVFTGWYADSGCTTRVFFTEEEYNASTLTNKVLYSRMPANNLQVFAGWDTEWFLIEIDPNGGVLTGSQSTWFWEPYSGDPIEEYTTTTRNFKESLTGTYYYALQDRASYGLTDEWDPREDNISNRGAYYTTDVSDPNVDLSKRYEPEQDAYRYVGWYEVHEDGTETLYAFGQPVMHNTKLRLHWKQIGTYFLRYDAGDGTIDDADNSEETFKTYDSADYSDHANVVVARTANAPEGKSFIGWRVRGGDGTIYRPGDTLEYNSLYSVEEVQDGIEREYMILDAVYATIGTAKIVYDANGGTVTEPDYGGPTNTAAYRETLHDETTATISGLLNNSEVTLSTGEGFVLEGAEFTGWNTKPDATGEHFDAGGNYYVDTNDPVTLYAEWRVKVYFDKNNVNADWGGTWDSATYTWDEARQQYYTYAYVGGTVDEPSNVPVSSEEDERFAYWSPVRYTDSGDVAYPYDFSTPITGELTLYGFWANAIQVPYHVVDASNEQLVEKDDWELQPYMQVNTGTVIPLSNKNDTTPYAEVPADYAYAFACVSDSLENCSEEGIITQVGYNSENKCVNVTYADGTTEDLPSGKEIYLVYFKDPKNLPIDYKLMNTDGSLSDVAVSNSAPTSAVAGTYDMQTNVTQPLGWTNNDNLKYYSFAIGDVNAEESSDIHVITETSDSDSSRPHLQIRNTWRGYQYSEDGGTTWRNYGYNPELYVIYYPSEPTLVSIIERTIGTEADVSEEFEYEVVITTTTTVTTSQERRRRTWHSSWFSGGYWEDWGAYSDYGSPQIISETTSTSTEMLLSDGQSEDFTLFYTSSSVESETPEDDSHTSGVNTQYQIKTTTTTKTTQTITVTQRSKNGFTTTNDNGDHQYVYTYTTTSSHEPQEVTYTNTREQDSLQLHVALAQNGGIVAHDELRTDNENIYTVTLPYDETVQLNEGNPAGLFTGDSSTYRFAGIVYGKPDDQGNITTYYTDVNAVSFGALQDSEYLGVYLNNDRSKLVEEGYEIYYVYYPMPKIHYLVEGANGALTEINPITREGNPVTFRVGDSEETRVVTQGEQLEVGSTAFVIDQQAYQGYRVPPDLDGTKQLSLDYVKIGVGGPSKTNTADLDGIKEAGNLQLKVEDSQIKYSMDGGSTWEPFTGDPTVYVIYKEKGYNLTITKTVSAASTNGTFELTISSPAITETIYEVSGYTDVTTGEAITQVLAVPATDNEPGTITLTVRHDDRITIAALQHGTYTIAEPNLQGYTMSSAAVGGYAQTVTDDSFTFVLSDDNTAEVTNKPSTVPVRIIKVDENGNALEGGLFTLSGAEIETQDNLVATKAAGENDAVIYHNDALPLGTYTLTEDSAPDGYLPLEGPVTIEVANSGNDVSVKASIDGRELLNSVSRPQGSDVWTVTIRNTAGAELPAAGGMGTIPLYALGLAMMIVPIFYLRRRTSA